MRLTRRGRVVAVAGLLLMALAGLGVLGRAGVEASSRSDGPALSYVTVAPGETLWQIARRVDPGADPRDTVDRIVAINGLRGGHVLAGQQLVVPAHR